MNNTDYLSRKAIVKNLTDGLKHYEGRVEMLTYLIIERFMEYIKEFPAADVQPVKHGRWVQDGSGHDGRDNWYHCSECNRALNLICGDKLEDYPYCHCGARMDGDNDV